MELDPILLSRLQFAFTIGFHILFPTLTMGLALYLVYLEGRWLVTGESIFRRAAIFWSKIFALTFGMGVVSGVVLSYEIGTNFGAWSQATGNVLGPLLAYEVLSAFFLEAGFLGIMLFAWDRVGPRLHFLATSMVFVGTMLSAFWILSANSWMHTPAGYRLEDGVFFPTSWARVVLNPSFPYRLGHMLNASFLTTAFVVAAVAAWYLRHALFREFARPMLRLALYTAALLAPLQILLGDWHGLNTLKHQPTKVAAMEGHWEAERGAPLYLVAWPDMTAAENRWAVGIPHVASLILQHSWNGRVPGLKEVPQDERPYVPLVFWAFRIMVGLSLVMLILAWWGAWRGAQGRLENSPRLLAILSWSAPLGFLAVLAGWVTTEAGRQPWAVQGLMRTSESVSDVSGTQVASSLTLFVLMYFGLLTIYLRYFYRLVTRESASHLRLRKGNGDGS